MTVQGFFLLVVFRGGLFHKGFPDRGRALDSVTSSKLPLVDNIFLPRKSYEQYGETLSALYRQCSR